MTAAKLKLSPAQMTMAKRLGKAHSIHPPYDGKDAGFWSTARALEKKGLVTIYYPNVHATQKLVCALLEIGEDVVAKCTYPYCDKRTVRPDWTTCNRHYSSGRRTKTIRAKKGP